MESDIIVKGVVEMWIAVCDDCKSFLDKTLNLLNKIAHVDDQITFYESGLDLIDAVYRAKQPLDVLLLDIEMPGFNGIETGVELRHTCPNTEILIVTNYIQYAYDAYQLKPSGFLLKPLDGTLLKARLDKLRCTIDPQKNKLYIRTRDALTVISIADIMYVERCGRIVCIYTHASQYSYYESLSKLAEKLIPNGFMRIHKSFIVNLSHIKRINTKGNDTSVLLTNGTVLPVAFRRSKELVSAVMDLRA
ncbi:LytTR family DNA-binding domain-containing protein [Tyzzerella sp. OttesenSCG-928-J15]|nr:LytTR family DNA-binding domain-containing protein [Tyzzerella sp. OttesenSCG-928-J15]